jgi:transposase
MHLAWRWFTGLGFDQEIPHHSTFSKNRHGRFQESNLFQELFEEIVARCVAGGLVKGEHMSVDWQFHPGQCRSSQPRSARATGGSG